MRKNLYADLYKVEETHWWHRAKRELCLQFLRNLRQDKTLTILDIGCGTGGNMKAFSKFGKVYGVDISPDAIAFCKKRKLLNAQLGSAYNTKHKASSFDVVAILDVLEHVDEIRALKEIVRVIRPKGTMILTVPAYQQLWSKWDEVLHHKRRYEKKQLISLLQKQGFTIIKCSYLYSFLFLPVFLIRFVKSRVKSDEYSSDFSLNPKTINSTLLNIARIERGLIRYFDVPFGTTLFCIARKK